MESPSKSPTIISSERTVAALTWLRKFLTANSTPTLSSILFAGVEPTPETVVSIEQLRAIIDSREEAATAGAGALDAQTRVCEETARTWDEAGAGSMLEQLDEAAVQEAAAIADVAAALGVDAGAVVDADAMTGRMCDEVGRLLAAEAEVLERRERLGEAQEAVRRGAVLAARGVHGRESVERAVQERRRMAEAWGGKVGVMEKKRKDYENRAARERERVREAGVEESCRHEAVVEMGRKLAEREDRAREVEVALERFAGLPTDVEECERMVADMHAQIKRVDAEIQAAIGSMSR